MKAENSGNRDCPQRDSAEHEGYAEAQVILLDMERKGQCTAGAFERILDRESEQSLQESEGKERALGIDGMTVEEACPTFGKTGRSF